MLHVQYAGGWDDSADYLYWDDSYANGGYYMNGGNSRSARWNGHDNGGHTACENGAPAAAARGPNGAATPDATAGNGAAKREKRKEKRRSARCSFTYVSEFVLKVIMLSCLFHIHGGVLV